MVGVVDPSQRDRSGQDNEDHQIRAVGKSAIQGIWENAGCGADYASRPGWTVYCVGDIHGRDDLLGELSVRVEADMEPRSFDQTVTIFLGDYVDRGYSSRRVVERLSCGEWPTPMIALAGNHEDLLLAFLEDEAILEAWRNLGGLLTLHSYGVDVGLAMVGSDFKGVQEGFAARFPERHRQFLETLTASTVIGDYFFCHAGIRPGVLSRSPRPQ